MSTWDERLTALKAEYLREAPAKLETLDRHLEYLSRTPQDRAGLKTLMRLFHSFSGSGRTYGFPRISDLGIQGEKTCSDVLQRAEPPTPAELERWRGLFRALEAEFERAGARREAESPAAKKPTPQPHDILVVDDDSASHPLLRMAEHEGIAIRRSATRAEALELLKIRLPDGVITEVKLPDGSGYELVESLRGLPGGDEPAVMVVSGHGEFLDKVEAIHCGADGYFEKPVDWSALMRRLQHLLDRNKTEPARVLSVEDDPYQGAFFRAVLESGGYEVRLCEDPKRFEADLTSFKPDLVLMDLLLPEISGYALIRYLRQQEKHATLPVLVLTASGDLSTRIEAAKAGADDFIVKPVSPGLLLSAIAARIERFRFLKSLLDRDGLTRLLTHTAFLEQARSVVSLKRRQPQRSMAWVMLDIDHFKKVNDRYGHPIGDRVLATLSAHLRRRLRQSDTVGRYGGEEFVVLLQDLQESEAMRLVSRIREEFQTIDHRAPNGSPFSVTFSAGIAMLDGDGMDVDKWRKAADDALYAAKKSGRNRVVAASTLALR